jgi:hypothetical protein
MRILFPAPGRLTPGRSLTQTPTWDIRTLNAGPTRSAPEYDQHVAETVGSTYDWGDELRFDRRTGLLASFILTTPEDGGIDPAIARSWLCLHRREGLPAIDDRRAGFEVDPLDLRLLSDDGHHLVASDQHLEPAGGDAVRVAIHPDVDLLFQRHRYVGWMLHHPIAHLVAAPGEPPPSGDDPRITTVLRDYLTLVVQPQIDRMNAEDPGVRAELEALDARVAALDGSAASALRRRIRETLDNFYE